MGKEHQIRSLFPDVFYKKSALKVRLSPSKKKFLFALMIVSEMMKNAFYFILTLNVPNPDKVKKLS